ncbi:MAG: hypothetical protein JST96_13405 [Bacteroidetes bacterium]|nr:hypothetical protein [Bacteroidota bacterium]
MNTKLVIGLLLVAAGTGIVDYYIVKHIERTIALPDQLFGFAIIIIGIYFIYKGKKQQAEQRNRGE